ncbi:MAG: hypothetical protein ACLGSH_17995 [Acidobacteriota bacterium]
MNRQLGVYICSGCSLGEALDLDRLAQVATGDLKVPVCRTHPFLCGAEGLAQIRSDLADGCVNAVVVAACSPQTSNFKSGGVYPCTKGHISATQAGTIPPIPQMLLSGSFSAECSGLWGQDAMSTTPYLS